MSRKSKARPDNGRVIEPISTLAYLRTRAGLSQGDVAKVTGLTRNDVSRFENGNRCLGLEKVMKLAACFNVKLHVLLNGNICDALIESEAPIKPKRTSLDRYRAKREHNDRVGVKGEDWVTKQERQRLAGTKYENAVNPNFADDPHTDFDILSFDACSDEPIIIEVKTTTLAESEPFYMSAGELRLLKHCLDEGIKYELHRVYNVDDVCCNQVIYTASEIIEFNDIHPVSYIVKRRRIA